MRQTPGSKKIPINIVGASTFGRYAKISSAQTWNMFISDGFLCNSAGYSKVLEILPDGEGRLIYNSVRGNFLLVVVNANVYVINGAFNAFQIGQLVTSTGTVYADENLSSQICIVDGINAYIYNYSSGGGLTTQSLAFAPTYVEYHNSFFLFGTGTFSWYVYQYSNPTTIVEATPGQFAIQTKPDNALAVVRLPGQAANVLVMGSTVSEIWTQIGGVQNYRRNNSINVDYGVVSVSSIALSDQFVAWLAKNESNVPVLMIADRSGQFQRISTDGIDYLLSQLFYPEDSSGMMYRLDGHLFYQLTFYNEADNKTLIYDFNSQLFFNLSDADLNYHPARNYAYFENELYFIALDNASVYQASTNYTNYNENVMTDTEQDPTLMFEIPRIRIPDTIKAEDSSQFRANSLTFTMEQGTDSAYTEVLVEQNTPTLIETEIGNTPSSYPIATEFQLPIALEPPNLLGIPPTFRGPTDPAIYQPKVGLSLSRDGGITFGNEVFRILNPSGYRQNIVNFESMGYANYLSLKIKFYGMSRFIAWGGMVEVY